MFMPVGSGGAHLTLPRSRSQVLAPPSSAAFVDAHAAAWFRDMYLGSHSRDHNTTGTAAASATPSWPPAGAHHIIAMQGPGDLMFVPRLWSHAVLNLADS